MAPYYYVALIWTVAISWLVWDELPSTRVVAGSVILVASCVYLGLVPAHRTGLAAALKLNCLLPEFALAAPASVA